MLKSFTLVFLYLSSCDASDIDLPKFDLESIEEVEKVNEILSDLAQIFAKSIEKVKI